MKLSTRLRVTTAALMLASTAIQAAPAINVYKSATCGCCSQWIEHLKQHGFAVTAINIADVSAFREKAGVPPQLASCHTAVIDGYAIEGHVPASDIKRLLAERPKARGLTVPGMPAAAPGMDNPRGGSYEVLLFDASGRVSVYQRY